MELLAPGVAHMAVMVDRPVPGQMPPVQIRIPVGATRELALAGTHLVEDLGGEVVVIQGVGTFDPNFPNAVAILLLHMCS